MGMDVYGRNPKSEQGSYFRSNIWGWPGILDAIAETGVLPDDMVEAMASNIGAGPDEAQSIALADALDAKLASLPSGGTFISEESKFSQMGTASLGRMLNDLLPVMKEQVGFTSVSTDDFSTDVDFLREFSEFCRDSGGFEVW